MVKSRRAGKKRTVKAPWEARKQRRAKTREMIIKGMLFKEKSPKTYAQAVKKGMIDLPNNPKDFARACTDKELLAYTESSPRTKSKKYWNWYHALNDELERRRKESVRREKNRII